MKKKSPARKLLSKIIRFPFGGSNRPSHLRMAKVAALIAGITAYHCTHSLGLAMIATTGSYYQELWASSDRDIEETKRRPSRWWILYGLAIKHRSWLSHGPIIGTATRIIWGYLGAPFWMIAWAIFGGHDILGLVGLAWVWGALVNDTGHLILDV